MSEAKTVDARGLSCPEPVLLAQQAMQGGGPIAVEVSSPTARDNVKKLLEQNGRTAAVEETEDGWRVTG